MYRKKDGMINHNESSELLFVILYSLGGLNYHIALGKLYLAMFIILHNHGNIATEGSLALLLFRMTSRVLYSPQYHRQHCKLHAFEQFGSLHMHNHDDKYPSRSGFEPGTPRLQALVDTNEPSGPAIRNTNAIKVNI